MDLYILLDENGAITGHPILAANMVQCGFDLDNLPPNFVPFDRLPVGNEPVGPYEVLVEEYVWNDDQTRIRDNWGVRPMTAEEKAAKIEELLAAPHPPDYVFDEALGIWRPDVDNMGGSAPPVDE